MSNGEPMSSHHHNASSHGRLRAGEILLLTVLLAPAPAQQGCMSGSPSQTEDVGSSGQRSPVSWTAPQMLSTPGANAAAPAAACGPSGNIVAAWNEDGRIKAAIFDSATGSWGPPDSISNLGAREPQVAS